MPGHRQAVLMMLCAFPFQAHGQPLKIRTQELPWAVVGSAYQVSIETQLDGRCLIDGGVGISLARGRLPYGIEIRGNDLSGVPRDVGSYRFSIQAANGCATAVRNFDLIVTGRPILRTAPAELVFECRVGESAPQPQLVLVSGTWPNQPYSVDAGATPWLEYRPLAGSTPDPASALSADTVSVRVVPENLKPGVYRSSLVISTWLGANAPRIPITLRVVE